MGREVRRVPATWEHPRNSMGHHIPLRTGDFPMVASQWDEGRVKWEEGFVRTHDNRPGAAQWRPRDAFVRAQDYEEWAGPRPLVETYMPGWPVEQRTHYQLYETTTAGTPLSPPCATTKELAKWLADHHASAGPGFTATEKEWLTMIEGSGSSSIFHVVKGRTVSALKPLKKKDA